MVSGTLVFDIESHSAKKLYEMPPEEFVRLMGYKWLGEDEVTLTTDLEELREAILSARWIIGHNIHAFDLKAVFGVYSWIPLELTMEGRVYDTFTHGGLVHPAPFTYTNRFGKTAKGDKPEAMLKWFSLDEQAFQLGVPGKTGDLKEMALEFGDPNLPKKERIDDGFGKIPVDHEPYREYLVGDVVSSENVAEKLLEKGPLDSYAIREQNIAARASVIASNGWRVDVEAAQARVDKLAQRRDEIMADLVERYNFPTEGKQPWRTNEGKQAILDALADQGITPETVKNWPRTGTGNISLGGQALIDLTKGTDAEQLGIALAELMGQRSLAKLALDSTHSDGFVHPDITMLQKSGRWSTTNPGLTVWTSRGEGAVEKAYFIPDEDDHVVMEFDLSNADARIVAAYSGDKKFAERFKPGADGHMINAIAAWGAETVAKDPAFYRQRAKAPGHGWGYKIGARKMSASTGMPEKECKQFLDNMNAAFKGVVSWQARTTAFAAANGYVMNDWGRKMVVEKGREYTQGPALVGQSGTREIICDILLDMPFWLLRTVKAQIHDALAFSFPKRDLDKWRDYTIKLMTRSFKPKNGGQLIDFPVEAGPPGANWHEAGH